MISRFNFTPKIFQKPEKNLLSTKTKVRSRREKKIAAGLKPSIPNVLIIRKSGSVYVRRKIRIRGVDPTKIGTGERRETKEAKKFEKKERERKEKVHRVTRKETYFVSP